MLELSCFAPEFQLIVYSKCSIIHRFGEIWHFYIYSPTVKLLELFKCILLINVYFIFLVYLTSLYATQLCMICLTAYRTNKSLSCKPIYLLDFNFFSLLKFLVLDSISLVFFINVNNFNEFRLKFPGKFK